MAANTTPIFTNVPQIEWATVITTVNTSTATTSSDGTTNASLIFTADATDGSFVRTVVAEALGTNAVSVLHLYVNNGSTNGTASNNTPILQIALPASTASATAVTPHVEVTLNLQLPAGYRLYASISASASPLASGWCISAQGGDY